MNIGKYGFGLGLVVWLLTACHPNPLKIDVSGIQVDLKVARLEQALSGVTQENIRQTVPGLQKNYDPFFSLYTREILAIGDPRDSLFPGYLLNFLKDPTIRNAQSKADSVFRNFQPYVTQLEQAFKHYKYYYPELPVPTVYTCLSGYNQSIITAPGALGLCLDNYLGANCPYYRQLGVYEYKRHNMEPRKLLYDALYGWLSQQFDYQGSTDNLVSGMIHEGKLLYFLDALVPEGTDSLKIGYSPAQLDWCKANEAAMWSYLIEHKMLFSGDRMEVVRFLNPAPFTTPFGQKSPGRTGAWLGRQIVRSYMKKNPGIKLRELMEEKDYHKILNESGYSPD